MSVFMTTYEFELEIHADVKPGLSAILHAPPEMCREGEPPQVEIQTVYLIDGDDRRELHKPSATVIEMCVQSVLEQNG